MKHFYFLCYLIILNGNTLYSQNNQWTLPQSFGNGKLNFVDSLHGFTLSNSFNVTVDGGVSWNSILLDFTASINNLSFINTQEGWICGDEGMIAYTTDAGKTWNIQNSNTTEDLSSIYFLDNNKGFAGGLNGTFLETIDGGQTWTVLPTVFPNYINVPNIVGIEFIDNQKGWIIARGVIAKTTDGGQTWINVVPLGYGNLPFSQLEVIDFNHVWAAGSSGAIQQTTNGGNSWINHYDFQMPDTYNGIHFINSQIGWVTGQDSHIRRTLDGGQTWETLSFPSATYLSFGDIHVFNKDRAYLSGGYQLSVENSMLQWDTVVYNSFEFLPTAFDFKDSLNGWAGNRMHTLYKTTDGGCTWTEVSTGHSSFGYLESIGFYGNTVIVGNSFTSDIIFSNDGGQTWTLQQLPNTTNGISQIILFSENEGYLRAENRIYKTVNGGSTWTYLENIEDRDMYFLDEQHGWATGFTTSIKQTSNGGNSWSSITAPYYVQAIYFKDTLEGWVGGGNLLSHTIDGGQTWINDTLYSATTSASTMNEIVFIDSMNGWILSSNNKSFKTTDGGLTWQPFNIYVYDQAPIIDIFSPTRYYIGARGIVKYSYDNQKYFTSSLYQVCQNESILIDGQNFFAGSYITQNNCDTLHKVVVTETNSLTKPSLIITSTDISVTDTYTTYQWYFQENAINGANSFNYSPTSSGNYYVEVSDSLGCSTNSDTTEFIMVNTKNIFDSSTLNIHPNPTNGKVWINIQFQKENDCQVKLYNLTGKLLVSLEGNEKDLFLDLSEYPNGIYFISVMYDYQSITKKLIINK